jgi:RNA polymerase sigma-70 factor (ECF subfamily)
MRYTKNDEDAVEVLNNGFLKVFRNIRRYDPTKAALSTWIRTIIIHSCIDFVNRKQQIPTTGLTENGDLSIGPEVTEKIKSEELLRMIRKLPPATATVFNLVAIEGFSHQETAGLLKISTGTTKWHLSEARKKLQQMIQTERNGK